MLRMTVIFALAIALAGIAFGQTSPETINAQLRSAGPEELPAVVESIKKLLAEKPDTARGPLRSWGEKLRDAGRFDDAAELALTGAIEAAGDVGTTEALLQLRVQSLIKAQKPAEAVSAAKSMFNVCRMESTASALRLLAEALTAERPDDHSRVDRLRREQLAMATTQPTTQPMGLLSEIRIDPAPFEQAIDRVDPRKYVFHQDEVRDLLLLGNLLLMSDRAAEAKDIFERARTKARPEQMLAANEGIARAIKAQDGGIGRANAWVRSLKD